MRNWARYSGPILFLLFFTLRNFAAQMAQNKKKIEEELAVTGMTCASCANSVGRLICAVDDSVEADVNYATGRASLKFDPNAVSLEQLAASLEKTNYRLLISTGKNYEAYVEEQQERNYRKMTRRFQLAVIFTIPLVAISMIPALHFQYNEWVQLVLSAVIVFGFGKIFYVNAIKLLRIPTSNMDTLVALSTGIAFIHSALVTVLPAYSNYFISKGITPHVYFESAAVIISFIMLGKWLEERAKHTSSDALKKLIHSQPQEIRKVDDDGNVTVVSIDEATPGMQFEVRPGDKIALDGVVVAGESSVDQSLITGEPVPEEKSPSDNVFAGTVNQQGVLVVRATTSGSDTKLSRIVELVKRAQGSKAPIQSLVDKVASIFVPTVIVIALISAGAWLFSSNPNSVAMALNALISVLVIACPCALGLATPTAIMVGVGRAATVGALIKDARGLEDLSKVNVMVFDKTGTLTLGEPKVVSVKWESGSETSENKDRIAAVMSKSTHPLSVAILGSLDNNHGNTGVSEFINIPGQGITATVDGVNVVVGKKDLMWQQNIEVADDAGELTQVLVAIDGKLVARFEIEDPIKPNAREAIQTLNEHGLKTIMLSGDRTAAAKRVATELGISDFEGDLLPEDKLNRVRTMSESSDIKVAMVGDGINDAAALASADVGIAMGEGAEIANEAATVSLLSSDLATISKVYILSGKIVRIIRQNLFWAFIYNIIGIPVAAGVLYPVTGHLIDPMYAGMAMAFSSVSVVGNSLRLRFVKLK